MITAPQSATASGHSDVLAALRFAAHKTGLDFNYLLNTAMRESSLDTQAKSKTSSASGLFQFIDQTWLGLVKQYGERYGLGSYADAIHDAGHGRYTVASSDTKQAILALRQDPKLSALMAGESAKQTKQSLECVLGREVCGGELYAAHFLGPAGARQLIQLNERDPEMRADLAFPQAAKANRSVFFHADGSAKSVGELYASVVDQPPAQAPSLPGKPAPAPQMIAENRQTVDPRGVFASFAEPGPSNTVTLPKTAIDPQPPHSSHIDIGWMSGLTTASQGPRSLPQSPMLLSPGVVEILASLSPATMMRRIG